MNAPSKTEMQKRLIECLQEVQDLSGSEPTEITADTCPIKDLPDFDSLRGVEATVYLSGKLKIEIEAPQGEVNVFISKDGRRALRVREVVDRLLSLSS